MCLLVGLQILSIRENSGTASEESVNLRRLENRASLKMEHSRKIFRVNKKYEEASPCGWIRVGGVRGSSRRGIFHNKRKI